MPSKPRRSWPWLLAVAGLHILGLVALAAAAPYNPALIGLGFLAYTFGLRHALDLDHVAAIDNAVRQLAAEGRDPTAAGFWFSLGHSTVVLLLAVGLSVAAGWVTANLADWSDLGSQVGPKVSGVFLLLIGLLNLGLWLGVLGQFLRARRGEDVAAKAQAGSFLVRLLRPVFGWINRSWHLYPVGFLFGLGFDTASEVALLALSVQAGVDGLHWLGLLALPLLFAAGMSLLDFLDGLMMTRAWAWATVQSANRVWCNLMLTGLSMTTALLIGGLQLFQVYGPGLGLTGGPWSALHDLEVTTFGWWLAALSAASWLASWLWWKNHRRKSQYVPQGE